MDEAKRLAEKLLATDGLILIVTGAGISLASGIPTFRGVDPEAIWKRDVTELGTVNYFRADPVGSWQWYLSRFSGVLDKQPNPAHRALARLERWSVSGQHSMLLVTQNVDTLHELAGSTELVKVHGSADRVRCSQDGCANGAPRGSLPRSGLDMDPFLANPDHKTLPRCPACEAILRQHVLWFDEHYLSHRDYQWARVEQAADRAELVLFIGTSLSVGVTEWVLRAALHRGVEVINVDPGARGDDSRPWVHFSTPAEELLPAACEHIGAT